MPEQVQAEWQCWKCKTQALLTAPTEADCNAALDELGWRLEFGLVWCPECWRSRLPSESWSGKFRSDRS